MRSIPLWTTVIGKHRSAQQIKTFRLLPRNNQCLWDVLTACILHSFQTPTPSVQNLYAAPKLPQNTIFLLLTTRMSGMLPVQKREQQFNKYLSQGSPGDRHPQDGEKGATMTDTLSCWFCLDEAIKTWGRSKINSRTENYKLTWTREDVLIYTGHGVWGWGWDCT